MSKALKYLSDTRPEAMEAYFGFLRANGRSLDPKTRALISVITKVANQTEAGLRQYAQKAIRDGVSSEEVLDAIMMAFPALGLTKTVWAVDILLDCGVFGEDTDGDVDLEVWHDVCAADAGSGIRVLECDGRHLFVVEEAGVWRVFDAKCPHHGTSLAYCQVQGTTVECPLHGWRFDLRTGSCVRFGTQNLAELDTRVDASRLFARW